MGDPSPLRRTLRFGVYQCDLSAGELHKNGIKVRLSDQPFRLLTILLERHGEVVTRRELGERLWPAGTFVDFEDGLNTAIKKLRVALDDQSENPRFLETIPRRGYRFIAPVEEIGGNGATKATTAKATACSDSGVEREAGSKRRWVWIPVVAAWTVAAIAAGAAYRLLDRGPALAFGARDSVMVADFQNATGEPRFDKALRMAFVVSLEQSRRANVFPEDRIESALQRMGKSRTEPITSALGREICEREGIRGLISAGITRTGNEYELTAELIDPQTGATVRSYAERSNGEDHILDALDAISQDIRRDLGESIHQIHKASKPLPEVTTSSLAALKQFADGADLWHRGKYDDAMAQYRAAIASDPDFAMAHAALGSGYYSYIYNNPALGQREYEKALALESRTTERERLRIQAEYAADQNHAQEAIERYQAYLYRYRDDWSMHRDYGYFLFRHDRAPEAIEQFREVLHIAPDDADSYVQLATAYGSLGEFQNAVSSYSQGFRLEPTLLTAGNINREYGFDLVALGQDDRAVQAFKAMLAKPDTETDGLRSLAMLDLYHGRYALARQRFEQVLSIWGPRENPLSAARVHFMLAVIAQGEGNSATQMKELDDASKDLNAIGPKVVWGALVGKEYARAGVAARAQNILHQIAPHADQRNPKDVAYLRILQAEIDSAKGDAAGAVEALDNFSNDSGADVMAVRDESLAHAYQKEGDIDRAIQWYEKLVSFPQGYSSSWEPQQRWLASYYVLASDYLKKGDAARARQTLAILSSRWKGADANLKLYKDTQELQAQLSR